MSASSQASGDNHLDLSVTVTSKIVVCGYAKVNAWDKVAYGHIFALTGGGNAQNLALGQDTGGDGTHDWMSWYWYNGSYSGVDNIITSSGVWTFLCVIMSGTAADLYYGTETGALSHQSLTAGFSASAITRVRLATSGFDETGNISFRGWRVWVDHSGTFGSTDATAERDSSTFAPVFSSGLVSDIRMPDGTSPETATSGTSWTRTGTFTTDASNPSFPVPASSTVLRTQRRALGFPPRAPLPGVARIGSGILATPSNIRALTLQCDQGSYALTGNAVSLAYSPVIITTMPLPVPRSATWGPGRIVTPPAHVLGSGILAPAAPPRALTLTCGQGSYALTGQAMSPTAARLLTATQGSYAVTGQALGLGVTMPAAQGSYALTGQSITLTRSLRMVATQGSYALTGQSVTLTRSLRVALAQGSYSCTGQALALGASMACAQGSYVLTGQNVALTRSLRVSCAQGSYSLTGEAVTLTYSPVGSHTLSCSQGSYSLTGQSVALTAARTLTAAQGAYVLTGQLLGLAYGRRITMAQGSYALTGQAVAPERGLRLASSQGSYSLTGQSVTLTYQPAGTHTLSCAQGSYLVTGNTVGLFAARRLVAALGTYALTGEPANLNYGRAPLTAVQGSYAVTGQALLFSTTRVLTAAQGSYSVTGRAVTLRFVSATMPPLPPHERRFPINDRSSSRKARS